MRESKCLLVSEPIAADRNESLTTGPAALTGVRVLVDRSSELRGAASASAWFRGIKPRVVHEPIAIQLIDNNVLIYTIDYLTAD